MPFTLLRSLSARVVAMTMAGIVFVSVLDIVGTGIAMRAEAIRQAAAQQETDMRVAWNQIHASGSDIREVDGQLRAGDHVLDGDTALVDRIKALVGGAATVFRGDLRVATNVVKPDGSRGVGTRLAQGPVHEAVLRDGRPYRGEAEVLGVPYFVAYDPIVAPGGNVVGVLFVGVPKAEFFAPVDAFIWRAGTVGIVVALAVAGLVLVATRRLFSPLDGLRRAMERLARGDDAAVVAGAERNDDVGGMARAVVLFQESARERRQLETSSAALRDTAEAERRRGETFRVEAASALSAAVAALGAGLDHLSQGDLTYRLSETFASDYRKLQEDFNAAVGQLQDAMAVIGQDAQGILAMAGEVSRTSDDLSRRIEQQAAGLEETAAALDGITGAMRGTAAAAVEARTTAAAAKVEAEGSTTVVAGAMTAMDGIARSSREIGQIIGVIDEIAFQTNLLALNAGVEAARAGDAGRGFAVVASEVRALAQRSAEAAKEIKALISASAAEVGTGVDLVGRTGAALERILGHVAALHGAVDRITGAAQEQAGSLQEVNTAVGDIDRVTQQNAALVQETSGASDRLAQAAGGLSDLIGRFRVGDPARSEPARSRRAA